MGFEYPKFGYFSCSLYVCNGIDNIPHGIEQLSLVHKLSHIIPNETVVNAHDDILCTLAHNYSSWATTVNPFWKG